jgi:transposase
LDENGEIVLEQKLPTTPEAMKQTFGRMLRSHMALETGTQFLLGEPIVDGAGGTK